MYMLDNVWISIFGHLSTEDEKTILSVLISCKYFNNIGENVFKKFLHTKRTLYNEIKKYCLPHLVPLYIRRYNTYKAYKLGDDNCIIENERVNNAFINVFDTCPTNFVFLLQHRFLISVCYNCATLCNHRINNLPFQRLIAETDINYFYSPSKSHLTFDCNIFTTEEEEDEATSDSDSITASFDYTHFFESCKICGDVNKNNKKGHNLLVVVVSRMSENAPVGVRASSFYHMFNRPVF